MAEDKSGAAGAWDWRKIEAGRRRRLMKKIFLALLTSFLLHASVQAADKIRIGFAGVTVTAVPLILGEKRGFFQEEGLQAEFIQMLPTVGIAANVSGDIDYWTTFGPLTIAGAIRGLPVKIVACYVPSVPYALISRPEFKSVQELRGKTIGVNVFGGAQETIAKLIFKHFGLDPDKEIKFLVPGGTEARFASMKQGLTAATLGSPPLDFLGKKIGFVVLARSQELFSWPISGLAASVKKIKERPDEIKRVIKAGIKANRYIRQNREGTIQFMMGWMKIDKEMATATYESSWKIYNEDGSVPEDGLRLIIEEAKKAIKVDREVSFNEVVDLSILREAQRELGIKGR
jgi:ABC-type nitrate/sulfonate/bicarbonate transport system substrate-binding protein